VEGLAWQRNARNVSDVEREAILRVLVPMVRRASASTHDAQIWGYIVASAAAETMELGDSVLTVWASTIWEYGSDNVQAWAAVLSILVPPQTSTNFVDQDCYLPLVQGKWLGCPLPQEAFLIAMQNSQAAKILGYLHQELQVAPLLAAFLVRAIKNGNYMLVSSLIHESTLETLWKQPGLDLVASASAWVATLAASENNNNNNNDGDIVPPEYSNVLKEFHKMDPNAAEQSFAHALQQQTTNEHEDSLEQRSRLVRVLEEVVAAPLRGEGGEVTLPPRVALDHANAEVRLDAIAKLMASSEKKAEKEESEVATLSPLVETFVRRWSQESDFQVAKALGKAICKLLQLINDNALQLDARLVLAGFCRWIESKDSDTGFVRSSMQMIKTALGWKDGGARETQLMLEACTAHLFHKNKHIVKTVKTAICESSSSPGQSEDEMGMDQVANGILKNHASFLMQMLEGMRKGTVQHDTSLPAQLVTRGQCAFNVLSLFSDHARSISSDEATARFCLELSAAFLGSSSAGNLGPEKQSKILQCLENFAPMLSLSNSISLTVVTLGSVSDDFYKTVSIPALRAVLAKACDEKGRQLSPVAILLESLLSQHLRVEVICRLMDLAAEYASSGNTPVESFPGVIHALTLLEHDSDKVRLAAASFLEKIGQIYGDSFSGWKTCGELSGLKSVYTDIFSGLTGSQHFESLTAIMTKCVKRKNGQETQKALLRLCNLTSRAVRAVDPLAQLIIVPPAEESPASLETVSTILRAMELAGEEAFPLLERWTIAGLRLTEVIRELQNPAAVNCFSSLLKSVVEMLKGRYLANAKTAFASGHRVGGAGGRTRFYSLGIIGDVKTVESYPTQMSTVIVKILKSRTPGGLELGSFLLKGLFLDNAWVDGVFSKLDLSIRMQIFGAVVDLVEHDYSDTAAAAFLQLSFDGADIQGYLRECMKGAPPSLSSVVSVARFVTANAEKLGGSDHGAQLLETLFDTLVGLRSLSQKYAASDFEHACQSVISALNLLCRSTKLPTKPSSANLQSFPLLLHFQGGKTQHLFSAKKYRLSALSLTAALADKYPAEGLLALRDSFKAAIDNSSFNSLGQKHRVELVSTVLGVFWRHASYENVAFTSILHVLAEDLPDDKMEANRSLLPDLVHSLSNSTSSNLENSTEESMSCVGALVAMSVAIQTQQGSNGAYDTALEIMRCAPKSSKMSSLVLVFQYTKSIIADLTSDQSGSVDDVPPPIPSHKELSAMATQTMRSDGGPTVVVELNSDSVRNSLLKFIVGLARVLHECLQMGDVQKMIRKGTGEEARCCLSLWQGSLFLLLVTQSVECPRNAENALWQTLSGLLGEIRDELQSIMPITLFLASWSRLLEEDARSDTLSQALELVAERVGEIHPRSSEASLFLGLVPHLCEAIGGVNVWSERTTDSDQSALLAVENIARVLLLGSNDGADMANSAGPLVTKVIEKIASILDTRSRELNFGKVKFEDVRSPHRDLICSLALTAATMIRIVGVRTLPHLPKVLTPLVAALSIANDEVDCRGSESKTSGPRDMQLATIRAITAIAESVPQFLGPHLRLLMVDSALLSKSLRSGSDRVLHQAVVQLDSAISAHVPARLFIPALGRVRSSRLYVPLTICLL
jgi:hypothetical protein